MEPITTTTEKCGSAFIKIPLRCFFKHTFLRGGVYAVIEPASKCSRNLFIGKKNDDNKINAVLKFFLVYLFMRPKFQL